MRVLLTNDDSHRSPLLKFIIEALRPQCELTVVVPKHEQSWRGKAMNRYQNLHLEQTVIGDQSAYTVDGTPADCVNIGVYHLFKEKPDLIVSGINAGLNTGTAFALCSGTLGACFEGNIAGVPGLALSQEFNSAMHNAYAAEYIIEETLRENLRRQTADVLEKILPDFLSLKAFPKPLTWSVNIPFQLAESKVKIKVCRLGNTRYGSCYKNCEQSFVQQMLDIESDQSEDSDTFNIARGIVTMTAIDFNSFAQDVRSDLFSSE